jgi:(p)ppGpp synthase/HD superfamily hydrolase
MNNGVNHDRLADAFSFAATAHAEQVRKGTNIPYVSHLMSVSALVLEHGGDEDQVA